MIDAQDFGFNVNKLRQLLEEHEGVEEAKGTTAPPPKPAPSTTKPFSTPFDAGFVNQMKDMMMSGNINQNKGMQQPLPNKPVDTDVQKTNEGKIHEVDNMRIRVKRKMKAKRIRVAHADKETMESSRKRYEREKGFIHIDPSRVKK